jgi:tetratricopeptide (TPR) repeat protein
VESTASPLVQDAVVREADCLLMLKRYGQATAAYKKVIDFGWKEADYALFQQATIAGIKTPAEKIKLLSLFENAYPGSPLLTASWMALADTYMEDEQFNQAKPFLEKIIAKEKSAQLLPQAYFKLGIAHYNSDNNTAARNQFNYILDHFANSEEAADALENLKAIYLEEGRSADFISYVKGKGLSISATAEDSLLFSAAEQLFNKSSFDEAAQALQQYLVEVPAPAFSLDAYAMLATIASQKKEYEKAITYYDSVLKVAPNRYAEEASLQAARISYFEQKKYVDAVRYYGQLYELTGLSSSKLEALRGLLRAHYLLGQLEEASLRGAALLNEKGVSQDDKALVALVAAKKYSQQGREEEAQFNLRQVISLNKASLAAEARYELASSLFRKQQFKAAEKAAFETINKSGSYEDWVTRAYLLLGDIYFAQSDYFNAKATYQSVKDNASSEEFRKQAAEGVEKVERAEADKPSSSTKSNK